MGTLGELKSRIASDLLRSDLTAQIANVIPDAISAYENEAFWFNTTRSLTFSTVQGRQAYTSSDLAQIPLLVKIQAAYVSPSIYPLERYEAHDFELVATDAPGSGKPVAFTYVDDSIMLWPTPDAAYTIRINGTYKFAALSGDSDSNAWTTEAEQLIRMHCKFLLYTNIIRNNDMASKCFQQIEPLLGSLRRETSSRLSTGVIVGTDF